MQNLCRLCGAGGHHEIKICDENRVGIEVTLSEKIFQCVGVQVPEMNTIFLQESHIVSRLEFQVRCDDESTQICWKCFGKINGIYQFRQLCAARNIHYLLRKIRGGLEQPSASDIVLANIAPADPDPAKSIIEMQSEANNSSNEWEHTPSQSAADHPACLSMTENVSEDKFCMENPQAPGIMAFNSSRIQQQFKRPVLMFPTIVLTRMEVPDVKLNEQVNGELLSRCSHLNCMDLFESAEAVLHHEETFHAKDTHIRFECHICKRMLADRIYLERHMNSVHNGLRPIQESFSRIRRTEYAKRLIASKQNQTRVMTRGLLKHHSRRFHKEKADSSKEMPSHSADITRKRQSRSGA